MARAPQLSLVLPATFGHGGARPGAGRKPRGAQPGISHRRKLELAGWTPVHVTARTRPHVPNLRTLRSYRVIAAALRGVLGRAGFGVVHYSIQATHLHLVCEADSPEALANGMRAVLGRVALGLNRLSGSRGPAFADRCHAHVLETPTEVRHAIAYVEDNFASHAARRGERVAPGLVDPLSSAAQVGPDGLPPPVSAPRSWLLRTRGVVAKEAEAVYGVAA